LLGKEGKKHINHHAFAKHVMKKYIMISTDGNLFIYNYLGDTGIRQHISNHQAEHLVLCEIERHFEGVLDTIKRSDKDSVYDMLIAKTQDIYFDEKLKNNYNQTELNLSDGIYCMQKNTLRHYREEDYKIHKLPYFSKAIDSINVAHTWIRFLDSILDGYVDKVSITMFLQEFIGHLFLPHTKFEKALLVYGS